MVFKYNLHSQVLCDFLNTHHLEGFLQEKVLKDTFSKLLLKCYLANHNLRNQYSTNTFLNYFEYFSPILEYTKPIELSKQSLKYY